jgi:hypothetical protein
MKSLPVLRACFLGFSLLTTHATVSVADALNPYPLDVMTADDKGSLEKAVVASLDAGATGKKFKWDNKALVGDKSLKAVRASWTIKPAAKRDGKPCNEVRMNLWNVNQEQYAHPVYCKQGDGAWQRADSK